MSYLADDISDLFGFGSGGSDSSSLINPATFNSINATGDLSLAPSDINLSDLTVPFTAPSTSDLFNQTFNALETTPTLPPSPVPASSPSPVSPSTSSWRNLFNSGIPYGATPAPPGYTPTVPGWTNKVESWFSKSSVIAGVSNAWIVLGAGVLVMLTIDKRKRRR